MNQSSRPIQGGLMVNMAILGLYTILCLSGCSIVDDGFLAPAGINAARERHLFFTIIGLCLIVVLPVILLTPWLMYRYRHGQRDASIAYRPTWDFSRWIEGVIWGVPLLIVALMGMVTARQTVLQDPYRALDASVPASAPLEIQAVALDWKWLFIYPKQQLATLNRLVVPKGQAVHLQLTSATVMQSLYLPKLSGQMYAMPGMVTQLNWRSDQTGIFEGKNTQFNGEGFYAQHFDVQVLEAQDYQQWIANAEQQAPELDCNELDRLLPAGVAPSAKVYRQAQPGLFHALANLHMKPIRCQATQGISQ